MTLDDDHAPPKLRTVTLTARPPVRIAEADWPVIGRASLDDAATIHHLTVRRHADGRTLVYAVRRSDDPRLPDLRAGELLHAYDPDTVVATMRRVAAAIHAPALADLALPELPPIPLT